jgi:hypothetical protein
MPELCDLSLRHLDLNMVLEVPRGRGRDPETHHEMVIVVEVADDYGQTLSTYSVSIVELVLKQYLQETLCKYQV